MPVLWSVAEQARLTGADADQLQPWKTLEALTATSTTAADRIFQTYLHAYLPAFLIVEDKISMAHSLESRTPFLDNEMVT